MILINEYNEEVIIPDKYQEEVKGMIEDECNNCIDAFLESLSGIDNNKFSE